ncbi:hypothetical protein ACXVUM_06365 [Williamsia sp. SKLECPSW1]
MAEGAVEESVGAVEEADGVVDGVTAVVTSELLTGAETVESPLPHAPSSATAATPATAAQNGAIQLRARVIPI